MSELLHTLLSNSAKGSQPREQPIVACEEAERLVEVAKNGSSAGQGQVQK
jgi:hypothetical protein